MKDKRPLLYLAVALLVVIATFIVERPEDSRLSDVSSVYLVDDFDFAKVASFEVTQLMDGAQLKREGDGWLVSELASPARRELLAKNGEAAPEVKWVPADGTRVKSALGGFGGLEEGLFVSDNLDKQHMYQVDAAGVSVRGYDADGNKLFDVIVGKNGPDFMGTFVRRAGENRVWLVNRPLVGAFSPRAADWQAREKQDAATPATEPGQTALE